MVLNPLTEVRVGMLAPIMVGRRQLMMDFEGQSERREPHKGRHHDQRDEGTYR
jgi:hypothetical protein